MNVIQEVKKDVLHVELVQSPSVKTQSLVVMLCLLSYLFHSQWKERLQPSPSHG